MVNLPLPLPLKAAAGQLDAGVREAAHREASPREARAREAPAPVARATMTPPAPIDAELQIARLEGRVAALEAALERRSDELRALQHLLCRRDLTHWGRLLAGLPALPQIACEPGFWQETCALATAEVPETLEALWSSLYPLRPPRHAPSPSPPALPSPIPRTVR
jgi:hypothetical protein